MRNTMSLKKNYEFKRLFKTGKLYTSPHLYVYIRKNRLKSNRIGICVSKKTSKRSVIRNRIRRLIRENYRLLESKMNFGFDIVIGWKIGVSYTLATYGGIKEELTNILSNAGVKKNE